ncbi:MAG: NifU family protein [Methanomicrobiales archaeon]|nr:NifU family protein [Methanomicrobiales archaeon]
MKAQSKDALFDKVERVIDKVRPALGVNIVELVEVSNGVVKVQVIPSSCSAGIPEETVIVLLEEQIVDELPEIKEVVAVRS